MLSFEDMAALAKPFGHTLIPVKNGDGVACKDCDTWFDVSPKILGSLYIGGWQIGRYSNIKKDELREWKHILCTKLKLLL
jgi:hypothetical protein